MASCPLHEATSGAVRGVPGRPVGSSEETGLQGERKVLLTPNAGEGNSRSLQNIILRKRPRHTHEGATPRKTVGVDGWQFHSGWSVSLHVYQLYLALAIAPVHFVPPNKRRAAWSGVGLRVETASRVRQSKTGCIVQVSGLRKTCQ